MGSRRRQTPSRSPTLPVAVPALWSAAVGAAYLLLYLWLAPPVSGDQDASELTLALAAGGIPHATGYPLYAWFGHWFCQALHAAGATWSYAANAWSALGAGLAVGLFHALAARASGPSATVGRGGRFWSATLAATLVGLNQVWTMAAALDEVHSWHLAWVSALGLLFVATIRGLLRREPWSDRRLVAASAAWGVALGLGLAHHRSGLVFAAPLAVAVVAALVRARRWRARFAAVALAGALPPLASYGFVVWRAFHPASFQWPTLEPSLASAARHVLGGGYATYFGRFDPADLQRGFLAADIYPLLFPGLAALALEAWRAAARPERWVRTGLAAAAAAQTALVFQYGVPDPAAYFLPAVWTGALAFPIAAVAAWSRPALRKALLLAGAAGLLALGVPWVRKAHARREGFIYVDGHLRSLWRSIAHDSAIVLWPRDMYCRFIEYQRFDGEKPGRYVSSQHMLTFEAPRREFASRFGFDPMEGLRPRTPLELEQAMPESINRRTPLPVVVVDRIGFAATTLPKPGR